MPPSVGQLREQEGAAAKALGFPTGDVYYVDSANGANGNDGLSKRHPFLTVAYALTKVAAGDTIVCNPGGSETVTATVAADVARVKIVCPVRHPRSGYTISCAGTVACMTVSASYVHLEGLRFAHTGATANIASLLTTAGADSLTVVRCHVDDTAITTTFTGKGIELTDACNDVQIEECLFQDAHAGVLFTVATGTTMLCPVIKRSRFYTGRATAFGIKSALTGTGAVTGLVVDGCEFLEANGRGAVATSAWGGTNGAHATGGPLELEGARSQFLVRDCRAYGVATYSFSNLVNNAGAGDFVDCLTSATVVGSLDAVYSDTTIVVSDTTAIHLQTTAIDSDITIIKSDTTAIHLQTTAIDSDITIIKSDTTAIHLQTTAIDSDIT